MRKNFILIVLCILLIQLFSGCSENNAPIESTNENSISNNDQYSEDDITVECTDLQSNINQWHHYAIDVTNNTDKYLTAEIKGILFDEDNNILGEKTVCVNNLGPASLDFVSEPFLALNTSKQIFFDYEIVSYSFLDGWPEMPNITENNIKDYIRIETVDYGDITGDDLEVNVTVHNLTPQSFSGVISYTVTNASGYITYKEDQSISDIDPFGQISQTLWVPACDDYIVSYDISNFSFV